MSKLSSAKRRERVLQVAERDGWHCHWCPTVLTLVTATLDHIEGGKDKSHDLDNLWLACKKCNQNRGNTPADRWRQVMVYHYESGRYHLRPSGCNIAPLTPEARTHVGTYFTIADGENFDHELGWRVVSSMVKENTSRLESRRSHVYRRIDRAARGNLNASEHHPQRSRSAKTGQERLLESTET